MKELRFPGFESLYDLSEHVEEMVIKVIPHGEFIGTVVIQIHYEEDDTDWDKEVWHEPH